MSELADHFGSLIARHYDHDHANGGQDPVSVAKQLHSLADGGSALELAIGTGRIAIPLLALGTPVHGIELSEAMVEELRAKRGGAEIPVVLGDMATTRATGQFNLVYLVFNSITNLTTQEAQVACFQNAADHLQPGGCFVVETGIPPLQKLPFGETKLAFDQSDKHWGIDEINIANQQGISHHLWMDGDEIRRMEMPYRYVWPSELDLMAKLAGMTLEHRWADWDQSPFTATSTAHVSVWRKQ